MRELRRYEWICCGKRVFGEDGFLENHGELLG